MDFDLEYDNKLFKIDVYIFKGEIIDKIIIRISRSIELIDEIFFNYDSNIVVRRLFGRYIRQLFEDDILVVVEQL